MNPFAARFASAALAVIAGVGGALPAVGQSGGAHGLSGFWEPKFDTEPFGDVLIEQLPETAVLIDDTGAGELALDEFAGLTLSERARTEVENYDPSFVTTPSGACIAPTVAFYMQAPFPMEIYEGRDMIVFAMEYYDLYRVIFLDGRDHPPEDAPRSKSGHSIGHWEGDTLVVDTTHIMAGTFMNNGFDHSDDMHIVERFRLSPDGSTLWVTQLYDDPNTFDGLAARYMAFTRNPGQYIFPFNCDPGYLVR